MPTPPDLVAGVVGGALALNAAYEQGPPGLDPGGPGPAPGRRAGRSADAELEAAVEAFERDACMVRPERCGTGQPSALPGPADDLSPGGNLADVRLGYGDSTTTVAASNGRGAHHRRPTGYGAHH